MEEQRREQEGTALMSFDPVVLILDVAKKWLVILLVALIAGVSAYISTDASYRPLYRTSATFVVTAKSSSSTIYNNLSSTSSVAAVFTELLNSSLMRKYIMQEMGVTHLSSTISTQVIPETNLIVMNVTAGDPREAFLVARTLIEHHEKLTYQFAEGIVMDVLQAPVVPYGPSNYADAAGQMKKMAVLGALAAIVVLAILSWMKDTVRSRQEAEDKLDCVYLGELPHENKYKTLLSMLRRRKTSILITNPATDFRFVESVRKLRRRVEHYMKRDKVLMITSLLENEGKSTVAVNLALSQAQKGDRVLLIDCDLRKPAICAVLEHRTFDTGVSDLLQGHNVPAEAVIRYRKTNMDMLLTRRTERNAGDLITSRRMQALLQWARENYDFVVLDLPPMTAALDAEGMSMWADASLLVIGQNTARAPALNKAIAALERGNSRLLGCVLNKVYSTPMFSGDGQTYGGYGGYRRYGSYGHYGHYGAYAEKQADEMEE
jgi:capsular exopolysaccharide synthesis family protein